MDAEPIESLMKKIMNQYNQEPEGWRVLTDLKGNVLVLGSKVGYRLKLVPLNPREYTGVGVRINGLDEMLRITEGIPFWGFRPLQEKETKQFLSTIHKERVIQERLIRELLMMPPVSTMELQKKRSRAILSGPIIAHRSLSIISRNQRELEKKLTIEAYELFKKKYPHRAAMYR